MKLRGGHALLKLGGPQHLGDKIIRLEEDLGVEHDVVDADDAVPPQGYIVHLGGNPVQGKAQ